MSNHNPYNVLVEMEDTAYRQPTTVESDGLEFQATPPPPPSSSGRTPQFYEPQQQNSTRSSQPIWSLDYYSAFFDVDTSQVLERCLKTLYPVGDFASETLQHQPDMYGPSWIATTVVFLVFVCSSLAGSLAAYIAEAKHVYDFRLLSYAVFVIYTYTFLSPLLIWGAAKYYGCQPSLFEIVNYYGYSLTVWIPVSVSDWRIGQQKIREKQKRQAAERKEKKETYINQTPFRHVERNFKSRASLPDFSHVIDFDQGHDDPTQREQIIPLALTKDLRALSSLLGETDSTWNKRALDAYGLKDAPGFIFIPNPFTPHAQRHLVKKCLSQYTLPPSTNNLDTHYIAPIHGYWQHYEQEYRQEIQPTDTHYYAQRRAHTLPMESPYEDTTFQDTPQDTPQDTLQDTPQDTLQDTPQDTPQDTLQDTLQDTPHKACSTDFQPTLDQPKYDPLPASTVPILSPCELFRRMRWTTLGYHYHWPTKTYHLDRRFPVPDEISTLSQAVARAVEGTFYHENGATVWKNDYPGDSYRAEAGVVNYYQYRDTLMGHVDRSELNMEAPLVSLR
ncbi:hypothetical protein BDF14DRAFT_1728736 [Spinellus fusiger]|nr:hypothetical protein BDF14DRAFT_1728736 [Spinellus fusiger]